MMGTRKIRKSVFPVSGYSTRFLPATKATPKELLPIVDKPLIQYAAEEAIAAGIDTLIFVTGSNKRAIGDHFNANNELETKLRARAKMRRPEWCVISFPLVFAYLCVRLTAGSGPRSTFQRKGLRFDCSSVNGFVQACAHEYEKRLVVLYD